VLKVTRSAGKRKDGKNCVLIADGLIKIVVDKVQGNQVHLSIEAPKDINIVRAELVRLLHATPSA
jgi:carbon storage regulator CsrA